MDSFLLFILEECEPVVSTCLELEQGYLDFYQAYDLPHYNTLLIAGSSEGFTHSPETLEHLREIHAGPKHPRYGTEPSVEQRQATSEALKAYYEKYGHHNKGKKGINAPQYGINGKAVHCYSSTGEYQCFPSINGARQALRVRHMTIADNIDKAPVVIRGIT
jgi:hypothetical protein